MASRKQEKERLRAERLAAAQRAESDARKRLLVGYLLAGALAAIVVVGIVVLAVGGGGGGGGGDGSGIGPGDQDKAAFNPLSGEGAGVPLDDRTGPPPPRSKSVELQQAAKAAGCELKLALPDEGNSHSDDPTAADVKYKTQPPTSGDHYGAPNEVFSGAQADGAYLETPPVGRYIHSLEHGRIEIEYQPDLAEQAQLALHGLFFADPQNMLMFPQSDMPYEVSAAVWRQLLGCDRYQGAKTLVAIQAFRDAFRAPSPNSLAPEG